jgi:hypothetical protein
MFVNKLNLHDLTAGSLSLAGLHIMNPNTAETYFNMLEKVATKNNLSDTPGNIFNIVERFIKTNNRPDSLKPEKSSKNVRVLAQGEKSENIRVIVRCYATGQYYNDSTLLYYRSILQ